MELETTAVPTTRIKKSGPGLSRLIRPLISMALLVILFQSVGFSQFLENLAGASIPWLAFGLFLVVFALVISAYKWQWLLTVQGVHVSLPKLFTSYLVGLFFNNFLPTNIGGDVVRIADIGRYTGRMPEATASVVGERLLAGFALGLTAVIGLVLSYQISSGFTGAVAGVLVIFGVIITIVASPGARRLIGSRISIPNIFSLREKIQGVGRSMAVSFSNKWILLWVIVLSIGFHATVILINFAIFRALGQDVSLVYCLLVIPIIMALQMIPISFNGLGVREGAYIYFFGFVNIGAAPAVAASLLFWALVTVVSLVGGLIFAMRR
ncbi:MAG: lysylphosphatidylglycerol synthase transmembrane domain-containing protein [Dehalococcoidia bacterium]|nr:lysylphosphatidylglycerol synthase transmembrane domain-containing protein [Dehalococcoidia bacterium]